MHYLIADETNVNASTDADWFIYGGLMVSAEQLKTLHKSIAAVREKYAYSPEESLKFNTKERPSHISHNDHAKVKSEVISNCNEIGVKFVAYMIQHKIIKEEFKNSSAFNDILEVFNDKFLLEHQSQGVVVIDRLPNNVDYPILKAKFQERIHGLAQS